jgi:formylglycine-generating enzyme required for sulfatase activity
VVKPDASHLADGGVLQSEIIGRLIEIAPQAAHYLVIDACRNNLGGTKGPKRFRAEQRRDGMLIAFAASPDKPASDEGEQGGPFALALAEELRKPAQLDLLLFHNVRVAVDARTRGEQVPWTEDGIRRPQRIALGATTPVARPPVVPATPPVATPATSAQMSAAAEAWSMTKDTVSQPALEAFIRRFGDTYYGDLAKSRLDDLRNEQRRLALLQQQEEDRKRAEAAAARAKADAEAMERAEAAKRDPALTMNPGSGRTFRDRLANGADCAACPEMVVVPAGSFTMGSPENEKDRSSLEGPQRRVTIAKPFAVGKFEVTFAEWEACAADGGCAGNRNPKDEGWGKGRRPVINVSWSHVREYVVWLSRKTGKTYRLLTEAEWEYAARAGTTTLYSWGNDIDCSKASHDGGERSACYFNPGGKRRGTQTVGSYAANPWGLHDMHGNVGEWVEDCWHDTYNGAPSDGSAAAETSSCRRVVRGGSWKDFPQSLRSAYRFWHTSFIRDNNLGFRVGRTF